MEYLKYCIIIISCLITIFGEDYCASKHCLSRTHIGCGATDKFKSTCPKGATFVNLNVYANLITDTHNKLRQSLAKGKFGLPKAANLCEVRYDAELAKIAKFNVLRCKFAHDCRGTDRFPYMGQNLYITSNYQFSGTKKDIVDSIRQSIANWFSEYQDTRPRQLLVYPKYIGKIIGHFVLIANYKSCLVGCAMYYVKRNGAQITCNYSFNNIVGKRTYIPTNRTGSSCKLKSRKYDGLCDNREHTDFRLINDD